MLNAQSLMLPDYPQHKYMLLVRPGEQVLQRMQRIKDAWKDKYGLLPSQLQSGHLLLARFTQYAMMEQKLIERLRFIAMGATPVRLELKDYFSYPAHTIGLGIANPRGVQQIVKSLQQEQRLMKGPADAPYFNHYPAISLATRLQPAQYGSIWQQYKQRSFSAHFIADAMLLLRKTAGTASWQILQRMPFENLPVQSRQGVLFA